MFTKRYGVLLVVALLAGCEAEISTVPPQLVAPEPAPAAAPESHSQSLFPVSKLPSDLGAEDRQLPFVKGFEAGYQQASKAGKPMLIFFTAEWCHYCHQMARETFGNQQVLGLADQFVCVLVDADAEPDVCKKFRIQFYPTVQFVSARGLPLNRLVGKKASSELTLAMRAALENVARAQQEESNIRQR